MSRVDKEEKEEVKSAIIMTAEGPKNRIQEIIRVDGDITPDQIFEILETATPEEQKEAYKIFRPGSDLEPVIPQEEE